MEKKKKNQHTKAITIMQIETFHKTPKFHTSSLGNTLRDGFIFIPGQAESLLKILHTTEKT